MAPSIGKQIVHGVRLTGIVLGAVLLLFVLLDGLGRVASSAQAKNINVDGVVGLGELGGVGAVLFMTASRWSRWVAPVAIVWALKSLIGLVAGTTVAVPSRPIPRVVAGETLVFFLAIALLAMRFSLHNPRLTEKIALVIVVFATCSDMLFEPEPVALALGAATLLVTRVVGAIAPSITKSSST